MPSKNKMTSEVANVISCLHLFMEEPLPKPPSLRLGKSPEAAFLNRARAETDTVADERLLTVETNIKNFLRYEVMWRIMRA